MRSPAVTMTGQADVTGLAPLVLLVPMVGLILSGAGIASLDAVLLRAVGIPSSTEGPGATRSA